MHGDTRGSVRVRVRYAPSRLLRSFTLRYAPFSRTVKGQGAYDFIRHFLEFINAFLRKFETNFTFSLFVRYKK